jgi:chromosome segregation ATPase
MPDADVTGIVDGLKDVSKSLIDVKTELASMKTAQKGADRSVRTLSGEVRELSTAVTKLDGKTKGLRADVQRVEKSVGERIKELKGHDLKLITKDVVSEVVQEHEDRFRHSQKGSGSSSSIKRPMASEPTSTPPGGLVVPRAIVYAGIFFGLALVGGGLAIFKLCF